jgi:hypothetical protein
MLSCKSPEKTAPRLVRHSPATALRNRTFIISERAARALRKAGVQFTEISRVADPSLPLGAAKGERI